MQKELLMQLITEVAGKGQLPEEDRETLEIEKLEIEEYLEKVPVKKARLKEITALLDGDTKQDRANFALISKLASNLGIDIKKDLGIDLGVGSSSSSGKRGKAVPSTWYVDGAKWINPRQEVSYILWTVTRGFGFQNGNGSLPLSEFRTLVGEPWDNGESFEVVVYSKDGKKRVAIEREVDQAKQSDDHSQDLIDSLS